MTRSACTSPAVSTYTDEPEPWRRLACAMLLDGALGAHARDGNDIDWIAGDESRRLAEAVGLPYWPPRWEQMAGYHELVKRARVIETGIDDELGFRGFSVAVKRSRKGRVLEGRAGKIWG